MTAPSLANADLAELLARESAREEAEHRRRALRRASRWALSWPEEAAALAEGGRSLTELPAVGPWVAERMMRWLDEPPERPEPPPLRRGFLSMAAAREIVASAPGWREALRGDHQVHTTFSDGSAPPEEMIAAAVVHGHRHAAITDHSVGLPIARGMDEARLALQGVEIEALNESLAAAGAGIVALKGIEMNLTPVGEGDMSPESLARLDLVLGAFHSKLRETADQTDRYLAALRNPTIHVLAHPRGRRWDHRFGLLADWPRVADAAFEAGVALEVDAYPDRQDLDVETLKQVRDAGGWFSIGTDAHNPAELASIELGLATVILAGIPRERVLNLLPAEDVVAWASARPDRTGRPAGG